jgi:predicted transcriptional regulator
MSINIYPPPALEISNEVDTTDRKVESLLKCLIENQQITNLQLSTMTEETYTISDIEG